MSSWRSRAKTSPGAAPVGTVKRGLHWDPGNGDTGVSGRFRRILSRSDPQCQETRLKSNESCGRLGDGTRSQPGQTHRPGPAATTSAPPTSSPVRSKTEHRQPLPSSRRPAGSPATGDGGARDERVDDPRRTGRAPHRAAVLGVRQFRDPVQGLRPEGRPARPVREGRRRRRGPPVHRRRADGGAAHPVGQGRRLRGPRPPRHGLRRRARDHQLEHVPGRRLHAGQRLPPEPARPAEGDRPPARVRRHHGRHRLARPQAVVRRRHQLPGPGRHPRPPGPAGRGAADRLRAAGRRPADGARVQAVRAVVLHDRRPRLGHGPRALPRARAAGPGRRRHRPPRARHQHRVHRRRRCCGPASSGRSTSTRGSTPTTT